MKLLLTNCVFIFFTMTTFSQVVVDSDEYDVLKQNGQLGGVSLMNDYSYFDPGGDRPTISPVASNRAACDCYVEPDASYTLAMAPNDDGSSALISIPFNFCMYGQTFNSFYINNNGNITFTSTLAAFSSTAFPSVGNQILAPFWADVDTRGGNGQVLYKITPTAVYINWEDVGYYSIQGDKLNTFQLIITDGTDPAVESGNVAFCYQDMQWTTGSASSGVGGFGGIPATCGANKGDGISYFLISQFDHPGTDFDGALGAPDGISWLDDKSFYFDVCSSGNVPPIPEGISSCDTFRVCAYGDTADISLNFLSPEISQTTSITWTNGGLITLQEISNIPGNTAQLILRIIGDMAWAGTYNVTVTGTDDFLPTPGVTTKSFVIVIENSAVPINPILDPLIGCDSVVASVLNGPYDSYLWDDFSSNPTNAVYSSGPYGVTVSINGCYKRVVDTFAVAMTPDFNLQGNLNLCAGSLANVFIPDSMSLDSITWYMANPALDSLYSQSLGTGNYNVTIWDSTGLCQADTAFSVVIAAATTFFPDDTLCSGVMNYQVTGLGANPAGAWSSPSPEISFSDPTGLNPNIIASAPGAYVIEYLDNCNVLQSATLTFAQLPVIFADTSICSSSFIVTGTDIFSSGGTWTESTGNIVFNPSPTTINPTISSSVSGIYTVTLTDNICGNSTSATIELVNPPSIFGDTTVCNNYVMYINGTQSYFGGEWSALDTNVHYNATNIPNPDSWVTNPGTYLYTFTDTVCNQEVSSIVTYPPFIWTEVKDTLICLGSEYLIYANENPTVDSYIWSTGDTGPSITVSEAGIYTVTASNVCYDITVSANIETFLCDIVAPNILSLSSQVGNNIWYVQEQGIVEFKCSIVNRWGNLVYEYTDPKGGWDGRTLGGTLVDEGTYFYIIDATVTGGQTLQKHGSIQVVH